MYICILYMYICILYIMYINVYTFIYIHIHTYIHTYIKPPPHTNTPQLGSNQQSEWVCWPLGAPKKNRQIGLSIL